MHKKYRIILLLLLMSIAAITCSTGRGSWAEEFFKEGEYAFDASIGYHHATVNDNRVKVGEYEVLDSGMEGTFDLQTHTRRNYFDLTGVVKDKNDQQYTMDFDARRIFETSTSYNRFIHYLDNDPLTNQDFFTDFAAGSRNAILIENFKSENTFRIPLIPTLKVNADFSQLNRRGHRQATTVSHCTECHVTSKDKRVNQTTEDINLGAEYKIRSLTFNYNYTQRTFNDRAEPPVAFYGYPSDTFRIKGFQQYSSAPDSRTSINHFRVNAELPLQSSFSFNYQTAESRNRETHYEEDYDSFAFRLTTASLKYVVFNFNYFDYDSDNDVPGAMEKDVTRRRVSFRTRSWKRNFLRGSYRWESIDRTNSAEDSTSREISTIALFSRPHRKVDFSLGYIHESTHDPFVNEEWGLFRSVQTSVPTRRDAVEFKLNWNPKGNLSLSSSVLYEEADSNRYAIDEDRTELLLSVWFAPRDNLILTAYYSWTDTDIDTQTAYDTYHGVWLSDFSRDNRTSYHARTNCYNLNVTYRFLKNIALLANFIYTDAHSDFDADVYTTNVGSFSDLKIERADASLGVDYRYKPNLSFYTKYNYRDYNDREDNALDGTVHYISCGVSYTF